MTPTSETIQAGYQNQDSEGGRAVAQIIASNGTPFGVDLRIMSKFITTKAECHVQLDTLCSVC